MGTLRLRFVALATLLVLNCWVLPSLALQLQSATYSVKEAPLFGFNYKWAILEAQFDDEVYMLRQEPCGCFNSTLPCGVTSSKIAPAVDENVLGADGNPLIFHPLVENEWFNTSVMNSYEAVYAKFTVQPTPGIQCPMIVIEMQNQVGFMSAFVSARYIPSGAQYDYTHRFYGQSTTTICPHTPHFYYGTYYVNIANQGARAANVFDLRYTIRESPTCVPPAPVDYSSLNEPTAAVPQKWIQDGVTEYIDSDELNPPPGQMLYYKLYAPGKCTFFSVSLLKEDMSSGEPFLFVSTNSPNPSPLIGRYTIRWASTSIPGDDWIDTHYCNPIGNYNIFYIGVMVGAGRGGRHQLTATTQRYTPNVPISSLGFSAYRQDLGLGATPQLLCAETAYTCTFFSFPGCQNEDVGCCSTFMPVAPIETPHGLFPWTGTDNTIAAYHQNILWNDFPPLIKGKMAWAIYMESSDPNSRQVNFLSEIDKCFVVMNNNFVDRNGTMLPMQFINFKPKQVTCDYQRYQEVVRKMDEITNSFIGIEGNMFTLMLQQLRLVVASWDDVYMACRDEILKHAAITRTYTTDDAYICRRMPSTPDWYSDPCCNPGMRSTASCRPIQARRELPISGTATLSSLKSTCNNPQCASTSLQTFIETSRHEEDAGIGCLASFSYAKTDRAEQLPLFVIECRTSIEAPDLLGRRCKTDSDCVGAGNVCLPDTRRCNYTADDVIHCLAQNVSFTIALNLFAIWGIDARPDEASLFTTFKQKWTHPMCAGPRANNFRRGFKLDLIEQSCRDNCLYRGLEPYCADPSVGRTMNCRLGPECDRAESTDNCFRFWRPVFESSSGCLNWRMCNWRRNETYPCTQNFMNTPECQAACTSPTESTHVCLDCSQDIYGTCLEMESITDSARCSQGYCTANPAITDSATCAGLGVCSAVCPGCDQAACESTGTCSDYAEFKTLIDAGATGACYAPRFWTNSSYICPFPGFTNKFSFGCYMPNPTLTEAACAAFPAQLQTRWYTFANDSATCAAAGSGCYSYAMRTFTNRPFSECQICEGIDCTWKPYYTWSNATWSPGYIQSLSWQPRRYYAPNSIKTAVDNFMVYSDVQEAITRDFSYTYYTDSLCRYDSKSDLVKSIVCDCNSENPASTCFGAIAVSSNIGTMQVCPFQGKELRTTVAVVNASDTAITEGSGCHDVVLKRVSVGKYQVPPDHSVTHALFKKIEKNPYLIVVNDKDAVVGQLLSDAATLEYDPTFVIEPLSMCIFTEDFITVDSAATVYMLAQLQSDNSIMVYNKSIKISASDAAANAAKSNSTRAQVCGIIDRPGTYFAVAVVPNYEKLNPRPSAEMIAAVVFYSLIIVFGFVQLVLLILDRNRQKLLSFKIIAILIVMINAAVRMVYIVPPKGAFKKRGIQSVQFIIFELPTFLYFSVFTVIVYLWMIVVMNTKAFGKRSAAQRRTRQIRNIFIVINVFMYFIFVIFIYLIAIYSQTTATSPCFLGNLDSAVSTVERSIKIAYWIYQLVVSVVLCVGFMVAAVMLLRIVHHLSKRDLGRTGQKSGKKSSKRIKSMDAQIIIITTVAFVCAIFLLVRSSIFLDVAVNSSTLHVIVFCLLEIVPQAMLLFYLHPFKCFREAGRKSSESTGSSKGSTTSKTFNAYSTKTDADDSHAEPYGELDEAATYKTGTVIAGKTASTPPTTSSDVASSPSESRSDDDDDDYESDSSEPESDSDSDQERAVKLPRRMADSKI